MKIAKDKPIMFAFNEVCAMSLQGGLARLNTVYEKGTNDVQRWQWRDKVREHLYGFLVELEKRERAITLDEHIHHLEQFIKRTEDQILQKNGEITSAIDQKNRAISFGVAQKILNLFLKYCWSLGWLPQNVDPPACPIDSRILTRLGSKNGPWSTMDKKKYLAVLEEIDKIKGNSSSALWELNEFEKLRPKHLVDASNAY